MTDIGVIAARCGGRVPADEELRDAGERDAGHADLAALDPVLRRHGLDGVVAVEGRRQAEQVERAARAARAAHLDADDREAEQRGDQRADRGRARGRERIGLRRRPGERRDDRREQVVRRGGLVAGVLDERRERAVRERLARPAAARSSRARRRRASSRSSGPALSFLRLKNERGGLAPRREAP